MTTQTNFLQFLLSLPQAILYGFSAAALGALLALSFHIAFGAVIGLRDLWRYLNAHLQAVIFSLGSVWRNAVYKKNMRHEIVLHGPETFTPLRAVIIPGTWSDTRYDWRRWQKYLDELQQCGYTVFKFQWRASNSEKSRRAAVKYLTEWLDAECQEVDKVVLIGHSYGGQVAVLAGQHRLVSDVITLAAPFISTKELRSDEIAHSALALFTRAFLFPTIIFFVYAGYKIFSSGNIMGIVWPRPSLDAYVMFLGLGSFLIYSFSVLFQLLKVMAKTQENTFLPAPQKHGASITCVQAKGDLIVEQLVHAAGSDFSQAQSAAGFARQEAIQRGALKKWALPYYFSCVLFFACVYVFPRAATILEVLAGYKSSYALQALAGCFVFIVYVISVKLLSKGLPRLREINRLLTDLSRMVDWNALARDNRRSVVCLLAGLPLATRLVHSIHIAPAIPGATLLYVDLDESRTGLHKHSDIVKDDGVTSKVISILCSKVNPGILN